MFQSDPRDARRRRRPRASGAAAAASAAVLACAGCTTPPPPPPAAPPPPAPVVEIALPPVVQTVYVPLVDPADKAARHLLAQQDRVVKLPPAELALEIARLSDPAGASFGTPQNTMDLALALAQTRNGGDLSRAQGLLDQVLRNGNAGEWHALARLLAARYAEQRRAEEQVDRLNQQLRDAQRDSQRRIEQLNDKLDALKAIERSLNSRGAAPPQAAPAVAPPASAPLPRRNR